ncbi:MAG: phosphate ABC transporter substrate-binding protein [Planctomycetota bacterium]|nr:MAG: phosphate ABC transporter substrate-binding protein [Planctomycetota bacterium]
MKTILPATLLAAAALAGPAAAQQLKVDPKLPAYLPVQEEIRGSLNAVGSDTMINLMTLWGEKFRAWYPGVKVQVEGKGSSTAPPALIKGTAQLGPMSRQMKDKEIDAFVKAFGYEPTRIRTSLDALAVYVHKDNPIEGLTLEQVDAIFGKNRKLGAEESIDRWGQLGLGGKWAGAAISLYGRNSASGTYGFFKKHALGKGDYKDTVKEQPGSASVVQSVTNDPFAIGYSGIGYRTSGVRAVPLSEDGDEFFAANLENVMSGDYPLGRFLNLYINKAPNAELDPLRREFIRFIFSREGQQVVIQAGYLPVPASVAAEELKALGIPVPKVKG